MDRKLMSIGKYRKKLQKFFLRLEYEFRNSHWGAPWSF